MGVNGGPKAGTLCRSAEQAQAGDHHIASCQGSYYCKSSAIPSSSYEV